MKLNHLKDMPKISVLTPSIRPEYLGITYKTLKEQTFKDFEWLVEIDMPSDKFLLPQALNKMLSRAKGDIIVMLQDCIEISPDFLQHVYDKYDGNFVTYPVGKREGDSIHWDWRKGSPRQQRGELQPQDWEADLASAPKRAFFQVGGYDERYCDGWSWDNCDIAYRVKMCGYKFYCDNEVYGVAIDHDKEVTHPFRNKLPNNDARARETQRQAEIGNFKLDYLPIS